MTAVDYLRDGRAVRDVVAGYTSLVDQRVTAGWRPYLLSFMFKHLSARPEPVLAQMYDEAERFYSTFLTRVVRRPASTSSIGELPVMIVAPDFPVGKSGKPLRQVTLNDGLHLHGVLLVPPCSRLREPVEEHFRHLQPLYVRDRRRLDRLDVRPIVDGADRVVEYALKSLVRRRFSIDDVLVLPRTRSELRD
jgi:hypothetical protein